MIRFDFSIGNPWYKDKPQKDYIMHDRRLTENWAFELQLSKMATDWFSFDVDLSWRGADHAGPYINIELLGYYLMVRFYNKNHWDYDKGTWSVHSHEEDDE